MHLSAPSSPHIHSGKSVSKIMLTVALGLLPGIAVYTGLFGWGVIINILIAAITALACEAIILAIRKRPIGVSLSDNSALVTAMLLALSIPPLSPWWIPVLGAAFAIIIAKQLYGGLGYNSFNPAMVGYVMLLISFPREMTSWLAPLSISDTVIGFQESLHKVFTGEFSAPLITDAVTMATPLDTLKTELGLEKNVGEIMGGSPLFGHLAGTGWEWISLTFLAGGCWLIFKRIISWHIPVALLGSLFIMSAIFHLIDGQQYASPLFHLLSGAAILGAFFIATDPVTACTTNRGRLYYGAGIGILVYIIRTWGGYPDAVAFAVLLMNMAAPTIDYYTQPRVFGHGRD